MYKIEKIGVVICSLGLAGALIAYEGGFIPLRLPGQKVRVVAPAEAQAPGVTADAPATAPASGTVMLSDSKYFSGKTTVKEGTLILTPASQPGGGASDPVFMSSSKDAIMDLPKVPQPNPADAVKPPVMLSSSKSIQLATPGTPASAPVSPAATASQPGPEVIMLLGSKSGGFRPVTPATSTKPATSTTPATSTAPSKVPTKGGGK